MTLPDWSDGVLRMLILFEFSDFLSGRHRQIDWSDAHVIYCRVKGHAHRTAALERLAKKLAREERLHFEPDLA